MRETLRAVPRMGWLAALAVASFAPHPSRAWELDGLRSGMTMDEVRRAMPDYQFIVHPADVGVSFYAPSNAGASFKIAYLMTNRSGDKLLEQRAFAASFVTGFCHDSLVFIVRPIVSDYTHYSAEMQRAMDAYGLPTEKHDKRRLPEPGDRYIDTTVMTWVTDKAARETFAIETEPEHQETRVTFSIGSAFPCN